MNYLKKIIYFGLNNKFNIYIYIYVYMYQIINL